MMSPLRPVIRGRVLAVRCASVLYRPPRLDRPSEITPALIAHGQRTVLTPHLGSAVAWVRCEMEMVAARDVIAVLQGGPPANAVNRAAL